MRDSNLSRIARRIVGVQPNAPHRRAPTTAWPTRAVVKTVNSDGSLQVYLAGSSTDVRADVLDNVLVAVGGVVEVLVFGTRILVTGSVGQGQIGWQSISYSGNWADFGSGNQVGQYKITNNTLEFRGMIANANAAGTTQAICNLPVQMASALQSINCMGTFGTSGRIACRIDATVGSPGQLILASGIPSQSVTWINLRGVFYLD